MLLINSGDNNAFVALYDGSDLFVSSASDFKKTASKKQPDNLIICLNEIKEHHREKFEQAKTVAVTIGPGSFTGIRVGLAIAKGIASALDIPIIPISNFGLIHSRIPGNLRERRCCILIPAKLPEYYYSIWEKGIESEKGCSEIEQLSSITGKNTMIVGIFDAETKRKHSYFDFLENDKLGSETDLMLGLALDYFSKNAARNPGDIEPLYMKDFAFKKHL